MEHPGADRGGLSFASLFKRFKLGAILGYLAAGVVVKILFASSFAKHPEELLYFSEFGVVVFLFVISLKLKLSLVHLLLQ